MPVYEYKCTACDQRFDVEQSFSDDPLTTMEGCEIDGDGTHRLKKLFSAVGISFKGDGFYRNDARPGAKSSTSASSTSSGDNGGSSSDKPSSSSSSTDSSASSPPSTSSSGSSEKTSKATSGS